jgi:hypothetical protein
MPSVVRRGVRLVKLDGFLLERERLLLEQDVVLLELVRRELGRPLGSVEVLAERVVELGNLVVRGRRDLGDAVVGRLAVGGERFLHRACFRFEALVERHDEPRAEERVARRRRELELRLGGESARAIGALGAGDGIAATRSRIQRASLGADCRRRPRGRSASVALRRLRQREWGYRSTNRL